MNEELRELAKLRNLVDLTKVTIEAQQDVVNLLPAQQKLVELQKKLGTHQAEVKTKENAYREECVKQYEKDGTKVFAGGKIKMFDKITYDDDDAKAYAIEKGLPNLLNLNANNVKGYIKSAAPEEFGKIVKEPRLSLASDLSDFLAQE
ncbi:hypothetical protein LCGC14_1379990 [marine sediment metagenome]|uniref:Uncharacterized protein n=1 Tax=marine sediment metagenome TaxID=412755 RepID=A0A0F9K3D1_9ZZZZ